MSKSLLNILHKVSFYITQLQNSLSPVLLSANTITFQLAIFLPSQQFCFYFYMFLSYISCVYRSSCLIKCNYINPHWSLCLFSCHVLPSPIKIHKRYYFSLPSLPLMSSQPLMMVLLLSLFLFVCLRRLLLLDLNSFNSIL